MDIIEATHDYESWLGNQIPLIEADLLLKHQAMREGAFPFLRATFYRWMQVWPILCPELLDAPQVLSTGDLHVENFGTWRDIEGRLAWGINDFDEAFFLPYPQDLVRLATSALIASRDNLLSIQPKEACNAILEGYQTALEKGGTAFVLAENHDHLRKMALSQTREPIRFWQKLDSLSPINQAPPEVADLLSSAFPKSGVKITMIHRIAGLGSLGRERYMAIASFHGGKAAREAKRLAVSACLWAQGFIRSGEILYQQIIDHAVHSSDPFTKQHQSWIVRRIAPDCSRIELADLPNERDEVRILTAMGWETANIHLGAGAGIKEQIGDDLARRPGGWLLQASEEMMKSVLQDWQVWKKEKA